VPARQTAKRRKKYAKPEFGFPPFRVISCGFAVGLDKARGWPIATKPPAAGALPQSRSNHKLGYADQPGVLLSQSGPRLVACFPIEFFFRTKPTLCENDLDWPRQGFQYPEWKRNFFYPEGMPASQDACHIMPSTFRPRRFNLQPFRQLPRRPKPFRNWLTQNSRNNFRFTVKSAATTH